MKGKILMNMKRLQAVLLALLLVTATGCGTKIERNDSIAMTTTMAVAEETSVEIEQETDDLEIPTYDETKITARNLEYKEFKQTYNAETG
ncbi:MAG: hypothetical protein ACI4I6_06160, partial [Hominimerdicola sp.]